MDFFVTLYQWLDAIINGWPILIYVMGISILCTIAFKGIQFTQFINAWKAMFAPTKGDQAAGEMTPIQAFINTLSTNLGNGSIAGTATAIASGGPGAALWMVVFGIILMAVRFAEVYLSTYFGAELKHEAKHQVVGGPMLYLRYIPGGAYLPTIYAICALIFGLLGGSSFQMNVIQASIVATWGLNEYMVAGALTLFMLYVVYGGSARVIAVSDRLVPVKVIVFCLASLSLLFMFAANIPAALALIFSSAFNPSALAGGALGFTVLNAMRAGMYRSVFATESGLGTAAILFGFTGSAEPVKDGIIAMLSTFVSTIVCFVVALCIVVSGVWSSKATSSVLAIKAFSTVFGMYGGWIVSFLSVTFGIGVAVSYVYVVRSVWMFITKDKYDNVFKLLYCGFALMGALMGIERLWFYIDLSNAAMLVINMFAILYFTPLIATRVSQYMKSVRS